MCRCSKTFFPPDSNLEKPCFLIISIGRIKSRGESTLIVLFSLHPLENKKKEGVHVGIVSLLKPGQESAKVTGSSEKNSLISRSPHGEAVNTCVSRACLPQRPGRGGLQLQVSGCQVYSWNSFPGLREAKVKCSHLWM